MERKFMESTSFGMYPFTVLRYAVAMMNTITKRDTDRTIYLNKETGVQVAYLYSLTRRYNMADPTDNKEYWQRRAATKAAFVRMMGWR